MGVLKRLVQSRLDSKGYFPYSTLCTELNSTVTNMVVLKPLVRSQLDRKHTFKLHWMLRDWFYSKNKGVLKSFWFDLSLIGNIQLSNFTESSEIHFTVTNMGVLKLLVWSQLDRKHTFFKVHIMHWDSLCSKKHGCS